MEWQEKLQMIIDYVEHHLQRTEEEIDRDEIGRMAGCSFSFFQKVFSYMNGISFAEYVRSRKLTLAGYDLKSTDAKVVDVGYKYGYDSPTSFTKAFLLFHGISPREARNRNNVLRILPKMQVFTSQQYSWRLEEKTTFRLIGKSIFLTYNREENERRIPEFWNTCQRDGTFSKLISMDNGIPQGVFGCFEELNEQMRYTIMVVSDEVLPEGFEEIIMPKATWAIFDCRGSVPKAIQKGWKYLYEEWVVKYPFQHDACPELEWYSNGNPYDDEYLTQIWIPVLEEGK